LSSHGLPDQRSRGLPHLSGCRERFVQSCQRGSSKTRSISTGVRRDPRTAHSRTRMPITHGWRTVRDSGGTRKSPTVVGGQYCAVGADDRPAWLGMIAWVESLRWLSSCARGRPANSVSGTQVGAPLIAAAAMCSDRLRRASGSPMSRRSCRLAWHHRPEVRGTFCAPRRLPVQSRVDSPTEKVRSAKRAMTESLWGPCFGHRGCARQRRPAR